jgi:hypothetical protein
MRTALLILLVTASPASAGGWREGRAEYWPEVLQARAEYRLCPAPMNALIERQRWQANEQALEQFGRVHPVGSLRARTAPTGHPAR